MTLCRVLLKGHLRHRGHRRPVDLLKGPPAAGEKTEKSNVNLIMETNIIKFGMTKHRIGPNQTGSGPNRTWSNVNVLLYKFNLSKKMTLILTTTGQRATFTSKNCNFSKT